jgi:hypothetical protein
MQWFMNLFRICGGWLAITISVLGTGSICAGSAASLASPGNPIDELVSARLQETGVSQSPLCSDAVFLRRVYLDVIGTLPTVQETTLFLANKQADKRRAVIDQLLSRKEFPDYWAMKWSDLLRVKAEFPINLWPNAAQAYHRWIRESLKGEFAYDRFARALLTSSGSNFREAPVNFYRAMQNRTPEGLAQTVALTFMGARAETWPKERLEGMAVFFSRLGSKPTSEWKEEILFFDPASTNASDSRYALDRAAFPDGRKALVPPDRDPREVFADWLIDAKNPWFARNIVNRLWYWLLGRGIIHEPDDIRPENPPANPELLACLEQEFVRSQFQLKPVFRLILNSRTYQSDSILGSQGTSAETNFSHYPLRRLEAEVLIDAICQVTGTTEKYSSPIPEPFTYIPDNQRSISLPDGSITSSFLELFGKPPRDTGLEAERNSRITAAQKLHLLNSSHIQRKLEGSPYLDKLLQSRAAPREMVISVYLLYLSRYPSTEETGIILEYMQGGQKPREALLDLEWALINSAEFLYRH